MSQPPPLFRLHRGDAKLVISVPHAGTFVPPDIYEKLTPVGQAVTDTDWHVDKLYGFATEMGVTLLVATHSRTVVDLNRGPSGAKLYPGQAETTICPVETFAGEPLYAPAPPDEAEIAARVENYWRPYHDALATELSRIKALHGRAVLLDGHSIKSVIPRLFAGILPDLNFGTNGGVSAARQVIDRALAATEGSPFTRVLDGRFRGGYITRHYGNPGQEIHAIQLELAQSTHLVESNPRLYDASLAAPLVVTLKNLVRTLCDA